MELKVNGAVPYWLPQLLGEAGCILTGHSKYCNALEAGDPALRRTTMAARAALDATPGGEAERLPVTA